jgi:cytochrome P450
MTFDPLTVDADAPELARLRNEAPVSKTPSGPWFLARHGDVVAAAKDVNTFRASFRLPGVVVPDEEQFINEIPEPRHGQIRRIINSAIAAHRLGRMEGFCRDLCHRLLDGVLPADGPVDLLTNYVMPVPNTVIAHLLGAPPEDYWRWATWSDEVVQGTYPTHFRNERGVGFAGAHPEFAEYVDAQIAARRAEPSDDFMSRLLATEVDGRRLTDLEARTQLVFLFVSGNETTRHLIGNLTWMLASQPALFERLSEDRALIPVAVEESLRHDPPVQFLMRECMTPAEMHGAQLCPRDKVAFGVASANRDESIHNDPHAFRLDRPDPRNHLGFGAGPHVCPGASLARLEARVAIDVLLDRVASLRLADDAGFERVPVAWAWGPRSLRVELEERAAPE